MSKLESIINEICPQGVNYIPLGEATEMQRGTSITRILSREPSRLSQVAKNQPTIVTKRIETLTLSRWLAVEHTQDMFRIGIALFL